VYLIQIPSVRSRAESIRLIIATATALQDLIARRLLKTGQYIEGEKGGKRKKDKGKGSIPNPQSGYPGRGTAAESEASPFPFSPLSFSPFPRSGNKKTVDKRRTVLIRCWVNMVFAD
jgi:hypothetical protein